RDWLCRWLRRRRSSRVPIGNHFLFRERFREWMRRIEDQFDLRTFGSGRLKLRLYVVQQLANMAELPRSLLLDRKLADGGRRFLKRDGRGVVVTGVQRNGAAFAKREIGILPGNSARDRRHLGRLVVKSAELNYACSVRRSSVRPGAIHC